MAGQRQPEWYCAKCLTRSWSACRGWRMEKALQRDSYVDGV